MPVLLKSIRGASQPGKSQKWTVDQNLLSLEGSRNGWYRCQVIVYARIKTDARPHTGNYRELVAKCTKFGWTILPSGKKFHTTHMLLTQTSQLDYEELCRLVILGLVDTPHHLWSKNPGLFSNLWQQRLGWETRFNYSPYRVDLSPYGDKFVSECESCTGGNACHRI